MCDKILLWPEGADTDDDHRLEWLNLSPQESMKIVLTTYVRDLYFIARFLFVIVLATDFSTTPLQN